MLLSGVAEAEGAEAAGEADNAARLGEAAEASRAADAAEAARAAEAADAARGAEAADGARAAEATDGSRAAGAAEETGGGGGRVSQEPPAPGGEPPKYHAIYDDGHLVPDGAQPDRLPVGPDPVAEGAYTRLRWDEGSPARGGQGNGRVYQGREFDPSGNPVKDIDFTSPTYPNGRPRPDHLPPPHQHDWIPNDPANPRAGYRRSKKPTPFTPPED